MAAIAKDKSGANHSGWPINNCWVDSLANCLVDKEAARISEACEIVVEVVLGWVLGSLSIDHGNPPSTNRLADARRGVSSCSFLRRFHEGIPVMARA